MNVRTIVFLCAASVFGGALAGERSLSPLVPRSDRDDRAFGVLPSDRDDKHAAKKYIPTFAKDVAPILYSKCAVCHHPGEVAPFSFMGYAEAKAKAHTIANAVARKQMPPWQANSHGEFVDERTLTSAQVNTLADWAAAGAPSGDLKKAPKAPDFTPGWQMGAPDFVGKPEAAYPIPGEGNDEFRCFIIPTHYNEDRWVTGVELRPGNRRVVHHVLAYLDTKGAARRIAKQGAKQDGKPGYESFGGPGFQPDGTLGGWAPGLQPTLLDPGQGLLLPKGADIVLQLHYHKDGKPESDLTSLGLKFSKVPVDKEVRGMVMGDVFLDIPAGTPAYPVNLKFTVPKDIQLLDVTPHMHWLGHDMKVTATFPDGTKKSLIDVGRYDFNWQTRYVYKDPISLPKGTVLDLVAHYDNSTGNLRNPSNPPKEVKFGEQTSNEMCFAFFGYTLDDEHRVKGHVIPQGAEWPLSDDFNDLLFTNFDLNHDGMLDASELSALIRHFADVPERKDGKPDGIDATAKMAVGFYGKAHKGGLTHDEFLKMLKEQRKS